MSNVSATRSFHKNFKVIGHARILTTLIIFARISEAEKDATKLYLQNSRD